MTSKEKSAETQNNGTDNSSEPKPNHGQANSEKSKVELQKEIDDLNKKLASQSVASKAKQELVPNKHNVLKAVEFFQANPFTLLIIAFVAAILQFKHAFWLLVVYLLFCYLYPLVTRSKKLVIDRKVETIISSRDQSINERGQHNGNPKIQDFLFGRYITKVVAWQNSNVSKSDAEESKHHGKVRVKHQPFNYNVELLVGIILSPIGLILQLSGSDGATDRINQLQSVL